MFYSSVIAHCENIVDVCFVNDSNEQIVEVFVSVLDWILVGYLVNLFGRHEGELVVSSLSRMMVFVV